MDEKNNIEEIADLACLTFENGDQDNYQKSFDQILKFFNSLDRVDVKGVEPMITPHGIYPELRPDEVNNDIDREDLMALAPEVKDSLYKVPPVV